jgi:hypothetical protein
MVLARVTPDGHELGATVVPLSGAAGFEEPSVSSAVLLADGSVMFVGTDPGIFLAHFLADGALDTGFGSSGIRQLGIENVQVDAAVADPSGGLLISGAHIGNLGRSVGVPLAAMLLHVRSDDSVDSAFAGGGAGSGGGEAELSNVAALPNGEVLASAPDGAILKFTPSGDPDLSFGIAGTSRLTAVSVFNATGLLAQGQTAFLGGDVTGPNYDNRLAVERVLLTGTGTVSPRARAGVQLIPLAGAVHVKVPQSIHTQRLSATIAAPLVVHIDELGDGATAVPVATHVDARGATVAVKGVGGRAQIVDGLFSLRAVFGRVAELDLAKPSCAQTQTQTTRVSLRGPFRIVVGTLRADSSRSAAVVSIRQACHRAPAVTVRSGRLTIRG